MNLKPDIERFLAPICPYNILVITGPSGCGKTYAIREALGSIPNIEVEYIYTDNGDELKDTYTQSSLTNQMVVRVIDPADYLDIPKLLLKFNSKYIIVSSVPGSLPKWCNESKVWHIFLMNPTREELLNYAEYIDPTTTFIPESITDYTTLERYLMFKKIAIPSPLLSDLSPADTIASIRSGQSPSIPPPSPYFLETLLNSFAGYPNGIEMVSILDGYSKAGVSKIIVDSMIVSSIKLCPKLSNYRPNYKKTKKDEEPEFEIGVIRKKEKDQELEFGEKSLFDF